MDTWRKAERRRKEREREREREREISFKCDGSARVAGARIQASLILQRTKKFRSIVPTDFFFVLVPRLMHLSLCEKSVLSRALNALGVILLRTIRIRSFYSFCYSSSRSSSSSSSSCFPRMRALSRNVIFCKFRRMTGSRCFTLSHNCF